MLLAQYGGPAGKVGDSMIELGSRLGLTIPPLNAILTNASTHVPGSGCDYYLQTYLGKTVEHALSPDERRAMAEETMDEVWRFQEWNKVLEECGLVGITDEIPALISEARRPPIKRGWATGPESDAHKRLKSWVAENPSILNSGVPFGRGDTEWVFASSDRADVMFRHDAKSIAVEVKTSEASDAELSRGIYQCVKYRALLRAELKASGKIPNGWSVLVTDRRLPSDLNEVADLLEIPVLVVPTERI